MNHQANSMTWLDAILTLCSRWGWVLAAAVLGAGVALGLSAVTAEVFQARAEIVPTVAGSALQPASGDPETWQARRQIPQIGARVLQNLALSGEAVGRVVDQLGLTQEYTADQFATLLTPQVQTTTTGREPPALWLLARADSLPEARRRANVWADVLKDYVDEVVRKFADEAEQTASRQLARGAAELETLFTRLHQARSRARLPVRDQEMFLLRQRYGQHLAQLSSLSLLVEIAEAHVETQLSAPTGSDAEYITARLDAQGEALQSLRGILAELQADAQPSFSEDLTKRDQQLELEERVLRQVQERLAESLATDGGPQEARRHQVMVARSLAATAHRLGLLAGEPPAPGPAASRPLEALVQREWKWEQPSPPPPSPRKTDDDQEQEPGPVQTSWQPDPTLAPIWIPPLLFPADILGRTDSPQLLSDNLRSAKIARDRIQARLFELRAEIEEHDAATAEARWQVDQAGRRYEDAREAYDLLAQRAQEIRLANLRTGGYLQITSRADHTGDVVSYGAYAYGRTGAVLGALLACLVILLRTAARCRNSSPPAPRVTDSGPSRQ